MFHGMTTRLQQADVDVKGIRGASSLIAMVIGQVENITTDGSNVYALFRKPGN